MIFTPLICPIKRNLMPIEETILVALPSGNHRSFLRANDEALGPFDARVLAVYQDMVITSPNSNFIPRPFIHSENILPMQDGRYGVWDCFQWPQLHCHVYSWAGCVLREEAHVEREDRCRLWWKVGKQSFKIIPGSDFSVGHLRQPEFARLDAIYLDAEKAVQKWAREHRSYTGPIRFHVWLKACHRVLMRIKDLPLTFFDMKLHVAHFQRLALDIFAMLDYLDIELHGWKDGQPRTRASTRFMGVFTSDPDVCQIMFDARVPVWFLRKENLLSYDLKVCQVVEVRQPSTIDTSPATFLDAERFILPAAKSPGGFQRHMHTRQASYISPDVFTRALLEKPSLNSNDKTSSILSPSPAPEPTSSAPSGGVTQVTVRTMTGSVRTARKNKKTSPYAYDRPAKIPPQDVTWQELDVSFAPPWITRQPGNSPAIYSYFPPPRLFVRTHRRFIYLRTWLACRSAWISRLSVSSVEPARVQLWRDFLSRMPEATKETDSGRSFEEAKELFRELVSVKQDHPPEADLSIRDVTIPSKELSQLDDYTSGLILWDLYELGFRFELLALDKKVVPHIWSDGNVDSTLAESSRAFPSSNRGISALSPQEKRPFIEAFRTFVSAWPSFPPSLSEALAAGDDSKVYAVESGVAHFYCQTFYDTFRRAPMVPHQVPPKPRKVYDISGR
ncbi:hypothetical protein J3R83DRAFT_7775 [Lanmaoa asiatica]|nr:hypothetical protein J3R83DRAFT_7775 [Lanmaoa asiatica]